jgi:hypothetical protein
VKIKILKSVHTYDDDVFIDSIVWNGDALDSGVSHAGPHKRTGGLVCEKCYDRLHNCLAQPQPLLKHKFTLSALCTDLLRVEAISMLRHRDTYATIAYLRDLRLRRASILQVIRIVLDARAAVGKHSHVFVPVI